jgi:hypothetical protein
MTEVMKQGNEPNCTACRFFVPTAENVTDCGECRRMSPAVMLDPQNGEEVTMFPPVDAAIWCGEFQRRTH